MATVTTFTVIKGKDTNFAITIKENGTTTPLVLDVSDTFTFSIVSKETSTKYIDNKAMTITNAPNGEVSGLITSAESATFPVKLSASEDGYISRPNLRLVINGVTVAQGSMNAIIEDVYVQVG